MLHSVNRACMLSVVYICKNVEIKIYKTMNLLALYWCETWSFSLMVRTQTGDV